MLPKRIISQEKHLNIFVHLKMYTWSEQEPWKTEAVYIFAYTEFEGTCLFNVALPEGRIYSPLLFWSGLKFSADGKYQ